MNLSFKYAMHFHKKSLSLQAFHAVTIKCYAVYGASHQMLFRVWKYYDHQRESRAQVDDVTSNEIKENASATYATNVYLSSCLN